MGYENQSKFSAVFRQTFQVLPTEYRRQRREQGGEDESTCCGPLPGAGPVWEEREGDL